MGLSVNTAKSPDDSMEVMEHSSGETEKDDSDDEPKDYDLVLDNRATRDRQHSLN